MNHHAFIVAQITAALATALDGAKKTHEWRSTFGAAFVLTALPTGSTLNLYVRRSDDQDAFAHITLDWSVNGIWSTRVWDTSPNEPSAPPETSYALARPGVGIAAVAAEVRRLAGLWLHAEGGVKSMTAADFANLAASAVAADA
jgi:hypothetical protein